jgi:hypothetical protein
MELELSLECSGIYEEVDMSVVRSSGRFWKEYWL